jgi:hypothetical protein
LARFTFFAGKPQERGRKKKNEPIIDGNPEVCSPRQWEVRAKGKLRPAWRSLLAALEDERAPTECGIPAGTVVLGRRSGSLLRQSAKNLIYSCAGFFMMQQMKRLQVCHWLLLVLASVGSVRAADPTWKAGCARAVITPEEPMLLAGYAGRDKPSDGKVMDLWVKALAIQDAGGHQGVFLTSDLLGFPRGIYENVCAIAKQKFGLDPAQIVLSASHTHCAPVLRGALYDMYPLNDERRRKIEAYSNQLESNVVATIGKALADLAPVKLSAGNGTSSFAVNRRNNREAQVPKLIEQGELKGPTDHSVPVLSVWQPDGKLKAVLFGYACHNTVMAFNQWSGDYAGYAQIALEKSHPGAVAMFFMGCGGDQNPLPRRQLYLAERYGNMLAAAVEETLRAPLVALAPEFQSRMEKVSLHLGPNPTEAELEQLKQGTNATAKRWASRIEEDLRGGKVLMREYPFPVQAWRLGDQLLITLGGEPVVDYSLKFKEKFGARTWVAGYCNDVMTYIPSLRVLKEGGYEGGGAMFPYGMPAFRWADDVEDLITEAVERLGAGESKHK